MIGSIAETWLNCSPQWLVRYSSLVPRLGEGRMYVYATYTRSISCLCSNLYHIETVNYNSVLCTVRHASFVQTIVYIQ